MKLRQFLSIVPSGFKRAALIILGCIVLSGMSVGYYQQRHPADVVTSSLGGLPGGLGIGLGAGIFIAAVIVCLGYVYGDARRRAMPALLSTLMAAFVPNLLGFLIYFVIRRPIALPCPQCGQPVRSDHRFCAWCGSQANQSTPASGDVPPSSAPGLSPTATA